GGADPRRQASQASRPTSTASTPAEARNASQARLIRPPRDGWRFMIALDQTLFRPSPCYRNAAVPTRSLRKKERRAGRARLQWAGVMKRTANRGLPNAKGLLHDLAPSYRIAPPRPADPVRPLRARAVGSRRRGRPVPARR